MRIADCRLRIDDVCESGLRTADCEDLCFQDLSDPEVAARIGNRAVKTVNKPSSEFHCLQTKNKPSGKYIFPLKNTARAESLSVLVK